MVKVSIIVPVFNTQDYLCECLDSLVNQTLKDIEIICINDGSTDNSLNILKKYAQKDSRIKIFTQENQGVSASRNFGLTQVNGEYLLFVDSDDWIKLNTCEVLYKTATERQSEILLFSFYKLTKGNLEEDGRLLNLVEILGNKNTNFISSAIEIFDSPLQVAGKFYNSKLFKENHIEFPLNVNHGEDRVFFISTCIKAKTISVLNECFYYYRLDATNSLTKSGENSIPHLFVSDSLIKEKIYSILDTRYQDEVYFAFLEKSTRAFLYFWNNCYNHSYKPKNFKYLIKLKKDFDKLMKKNEKFSQEYQELSQAISLYKTLFFKKLFEPIIEIEFRRNRISVYLFEKQILNFSTLKINNFELAWRYYYNLIKCRLKVRSKKLRVGFWVTEHEKWTSHASIYRAMENSKYFEPFVILTYFKNQIGQTSPAEHMKKNIDFFKKHNLKYEVAYVKGLFYKLDKFKPDIVFYQQPWAISPKQSVLNTSKSSLVCYNPYCFHSLCAPADYLYGFHGYVWKYFIESKLHEKDYKKRFKAKNIVVSGSPKVDCYKFLNKEIINNIWKTKNKKRIIYAPHHAFADELDYKVATFLENGQFILELAKSHPETEWIFRPHPVFIQRALKYKIMTLQEIEDYYNQWKEIGSIYTGGDYYELFASSDCLITDCISFLAEYLPTEKPVLHLRKNQKEQDKEFNNLLKKITNDYYKIYDNKTLEKIFNEVVLEGNDFLKEKRIKNIELLGFEENKTSGEKIVEYLEKKLWIKE